MTFTDGLTGLIGLTALVEVGPADTTGKVESVDASTFRVVLDDDGLAAQPEGATVLVSVFAPDALYRLVGPFKIRGRELVLEPNASVERIQRRKWPRRRVDLPVTLVSDGVHVGGIPGRTVDLSIGGCCVETLRLVEGEGDPMVILALPDGTSIVSGTATIGIEDLGDGWRYRLAFRNLDAHDAGRLAELTN